MRAFLGTISVFVMVGSVQAAMLTADADDYAAGTNISNAYTGLTLSYEGATSDGTADGIIYSTLAIDPLFASTGDRVFGTGDAGEPGLFSGTPSPVFRVDFAQTATSVSLDALGDNGSDYASLRAYTAGGLLLAEQVSGQLTSGNFETLTVSGADIAYVLAAGVVGDAVGFDNLTATVVPVPAAVWLFGSGLGALGWFRRKRV
jgi:hypothetical protein